MVAAVTLPITPAVGMGQRLTGAGIEVSAECLAVFGSAVGAIGFDGFFG